jgi:LacI family transcriptional regulator
MAKLLDIASKAGVSASTVSRVLNNQTEKYRISSETKNLIIKTAKDLNYQPNEIARGLRLNRSHTIGLIVPDISNPFFAYLTHIIQIQASQAGYSIIVCNTNENIETEIEQIELLRRRGIDGYIIFPVGTSHDHVKELVRNNKPVVILDRSIEDLDADTIVIDNFTGAFEAVEHLIENGHTQIAIIKGLPDTYTTNERVKGYKAALKKNNIPINMEYIVGNDFRKENGYGETKRLLKLKNPPTAIFATSDLITLGTFEAVFEMNLKIPEDISIVAFDDIDFAPFLISPLTLVKQPREIMAEKGVQFLINEIKSKHKSEKKRIILKPELIIRKSVKRIIDAD